MDVGCGFRILLDNMDPAAARSDTLQDQTQQCLELQGWQGVILELETGVIPVMNVKMENIFKEFDFNEKPEELISEVNGMPLPADYLAFMRGHNGGEGPIGENNYGRFFRLEELEQINEEYDVQNSWPGHVVIGGIDDALWAYNPSKGIYCQIDSCNIDEDTYYTVSESFEEFLIRMDEELE